MSSIFDAIKHKIVPKSDGLERMLGLREAPEHLLERKKDYGLRFYNPKRKSPLGLPLS